MIVTAKKDIRHDQLGFIQKGKQFEANERQVKQLKALGVITVPIALYDTKVNTDHPSSGLGLEAQSSALPVAPVSPQTTLQPSKRGGKRRKTEE